MLRVECIALCDTHVAIPKSEFMSLQPDAAKCATPCGTAANSAPAQIRAADFRRLASSTVIAGAHEAVLVVMKSRTRGQSAAVIAAPQIATNKVQLSSRSSKSLAVLPAAPLALQPVHLRRRVEYRF